MSTKVKVKKGVRLKKVTERVCGPFGVKHTVTARVCKHDFVHPKDWPFVDLDDLPQYDWDEYLCRQCFKVTITK